MRRTNQQNKALHKYYEQLAEALNAAGYDMRRTLREEIAIPWNKDTVKEYLWRPIQEIVLGKESTTDLNTADPSAVYDILDRHISEKFGIHVEFPRWDQGYYDGQSSRSKTRRKSRQGAG